jgi:hypothetical protein
VTTRETAQPLTAQWVPTPTGRFPTKGRQNAAENYVSASLCVRQTPEQFGGVSTD